MSTPKRQKITIPTYPIGNPEPLPLFLEKRPYQGASGKVYPIPYVFELSDNKVDRDYDGYVLENKYIKVELLPELGGKIHSAYDKTSDYDFIYHNKVIKPAMVGLAGPWISGGIEFNWPQHHRPTTFMPTDCAVGLSTGKEAVFMGEVDYFHQMKGMVAVSVDDSHSYIQADITVYNSTAVPHPFMWWANLAVQISDDYKIVFPPDVEYVNDHDRRAVMSWPLAKGVYHTARPFNYGDGTDLHTFSAVKVPSSFMISRGQSDFDFVSGYDTEKNCGVVTVANHHIAPGKKLWTWGDGTFGAKWCANLTDDGSRYIELMTGCYTDNQPDFTWIAPYETKKFTQYWYPVKAIGEPKCATHEGACNLEKTENGWKIGFYSTSERKGCRIALLDGDCQIFCDTADVSPENAYVIEVSATAKAPMLVITDAEGVEILSYQPVMRGSKKPIAPRKPALPPQEIETVEELYLNGIHLRQYKHFAYCPEDYFREGLKRDPGDIRCNKAMEITISPVANGKKRFPIMTLQSLVLPCAILTPTIPNRCINAHSAASVWGSWILHTTMPTQLYGAIPSAVPVTIFWQKSQHNKRKQRRRSISCRNLSAPTSIICLQLIFPVSCPATTPLKKQFLLKIPCFLPVCTKKRMRSIWQSN